MFKNGNFKVSIIVPILNSEKYLNDCLNSLISQTLTEIEIICADGGSDDNSIKIIEKFGTSAAKPVNCLIWIAYCTNITV